MQRITGTNAVTDGNGPGKTAYRDANSLLGLRGTVVTAAALNSVQEEIAGVVEAQGLALNPADNTQLAQAIARMIAAGPKTIVYCGAAGGTANAITLTPNPAITAYSVGAVTYVFLASASNTGPTTVNISGVGVATLLKEGPAGPVALAGGEIVAAEFCSLRWDGVALHLEDTALGTAAEKNASDTSKPFLASSPGGLPVGHLAKFTDANGTLGDGGVAGALANENIGQGLEDDGAGNLRVKLGDGSLNRSAVGLSLNGTPLQQGSYWTATAGGTSDSITAAYTPAITALTNGMSLMLRAASANTTPVPTFTPAAGTIAAKTIVKGAGVALVAGDIAGSAHWIELQYDATLDKWVLLNPAIGVGAVGVAAPPGAVAFFAMAAAPTGWVKANGALVSRTAYAALFSAIGTTFGAGDGATTFALPDLRGEFLRGFDDGRGIDASRAIGSWQKGTLHSFDAGPAGGVAGDRTASTAVGGVGHADLGLDYDASTATEYPTGLEADVSATTASAAANTSEKGVGVVRPRNIAMLVCIKY